MVRRRVRILVLLVPPHPAAVLPQAFPAYAVRILLRAEVVEARSIAVGQPSSGRIRPRLCHHANGLRLSAKVDEVESGNHFDVWSEGRRGERRFDAHRRSNLFACSTQQCDFDREARSTARATPNVDQSKGQVSAEPL